MLASGLVMLVSGLVLLVSGLVLLASGNLKPPSRIINPPSGLVRIRASCCVAAPASGITHWPQSRTPFEQVQARDPAPRCPQVVVHDSVQELPARHWKLGKTVPASGRMAVVPPVLATAPPAPCTAPPWEATPPCPATLPPDPATEPPDLAVVPPVLFDKPPPEELQPTVKPKAKPATATTVNTEFFWFRIMRLPPSRIWSLKSERLEAPPWGCLQKSSTCRGFTLFRLHGQIPVDPPETIGRKR